MKMCPVAFIDEMSYIHSQ